jgi:hypothetical protein
MTGQDEDTWIPAKGFTLGVNMVAPINSIFNNERAGFSFLSRITTYKPRFYIFAEAGYENIDFKNKHYNYSSNGSFFKLGMEYDLLKMKKKVVGRNDNLLLGAFYGYALQQHSAPNYLIRNDYWDDYHGTFGNNTVNSHWLEISLGPRAEMFKNFFLSWSLHILFTVYQDKNGIMLPYLIPGYGNGNNKVNATFSYNIEYLIPWKKEKILKP